MSDAPVNLDRASHVPARAAVFGMWLFLASLGMLFAASMLGYVIIRTRSDAGVHLPPGLWLSTVIILTSGVTMHLAQRSIRQERHDAFKPYLLGTLLLAFGFMVIQTPSLWRLLQEHAAMRQQGLYAYGLIFFLVLLHALHVVGGIAGLGRVTLNAFRGRYDHEHHQGVRLAAMYWHFLDAVWLVMFGVMLFVR